jgi:hypothetical protein
VLAISLLTAACGGSATASAPTGSPPPAASTVPAPASPPPAASTVPAPASPSTASTSPSAASSGNGAALCTFLTAEIPKIQTAGSTGGAVAELAIDYANWLAADSSRVLPGAASMDTLTSASCPEIRTNVLKIIGSDSFANGL